MRPPETRREFLKALAAGAGALALGGKLRGAAPGAPDPSETIAFFQISDLHYLADKENPSRLAPASAEITARLAEALNRLPGTEIPEAAGGGKVLEPRGVIATGDLIDSGDKGDGELARAMQETEWRAFAADFRLDGKDGLVRFPVHELHGNHDSPPGRGAVVQGIIERNRRRSGLAGLSKNGLHSSWDWGHVHFVNLGITAGPGEGLTARRRYNPLGSLDFLRADLEAQVGASGRPVVLCHHIDVLRYSGDPAGGAKDGEWDPADVRKYFEAIRPYNVIAILHGHTHGRNFVRWDGTTAPAAPAAPGLNVFNMGSSCHFSGNKASFLYFEIGRSRMAVREHVTADRWRSGAWTPQVWRFTVPRKY